MASFVNLIEAKRKSTEQLTTIIVDKITSDGLDIQDCRRQVHDNAAVMSAVHSGVQVRIKKVFSGIHFYF